MALQGRRPIYWLVMQVRLIHFYQIKLKWRFTSPYNAFILAGLKFKLSISVAYYGSDATGLFLWERSCI